MKTLLLATDFSENSIDACRYGYDLACLLKAKVVLVNAMIITAEIPQAGFFTLPEGEFDALLQDYTTELQKIKTELAERRIPGSYRPQVLCINDSGRFIDVIKKTAADLQPDLIVIGTHQGGLLSSILIGNHAAQLIDSTGGPLLIVKPGTVFKPIKKIAFATEFENPKQDLEVVYRLIGFAKLLNAEILLAHVSADREKSERLQKTLTEYVLDLSNKTDSPHIFYRLIHNTKTEAGLTWLCEHSQADLLAMAHHSRNLLAEYLTGSHTQKMSKLSALPLLVFPLLDS